MKSTIYFLYRDHPVERRDCFFDDNIEQTIRYWLGKSPGIHDLDEILVIPDDQRKNWMSVKEQMIQEEIAYAEEKREQAERDEYERLKQKYDKNT